MSSPWFVPVPVKAGGFTALDPRHARFDVVTDLARLPAFGLARQNDDGAERLLADLQVNADTNAHDRLGSGRAGVYGGRYLKGVGRTSLAANWSRGDDLCHNSGHLLASAAVREYLVSVYMKARGAAHAINPCEGLLLKPLDPSLAGYVDAAYALRSPRAPAPAPIDRALQGLTVKGGDVARFSNFVWLLGHVRPDADFLGDFFLRLHQALVGPRGPRVTAATSTPAALARAFSEAFERGLESFRLFLRHGVFWGSFHNNFTADGRFLDLETPIVLGAPFLGVVSDKRRLPPDALATGRPLLVVGLEVFSYVRQVRLFTHYLRHRLVFLRDHAFTRGGLERDYVDAVVTAMEDCQALFAKERLVDRVTRMLEAEVGLAAGGRSRLRDLVRSQYEIQLGEALGAAPDVRLRRTSLALAAPEPTQAPTVYLTDLATRAYPEAEVFNDCLRRIDGQTDLDAAFAEIRRAEAALVNAARPRRRPASTSCRIA